MYKDKLILENCIWPVFHVNLSVVKLYQINLTSFYYCVTGSSYFSININSLLYCWFPCYFLKWPFHTKMEDPVGNISFYYFLSFIQNLLEYKSKVLLLSHYSPSWMDSSSRKWKHNHPDCQSNNLGVILRFSLSSSQRISTQQVFSIPPTNKSQSFTPLHLYPHPLTQGHHHISHQANTIPAPTLHPKFYPQPLSTSRDSDLLYPQIRSHRSSVWNSFCPSPGSHRGLLPQLQLLHSMLHLPHPLPGRPCPYFFRYLSCLWLLCSTHSILSHHELFITLNAFDSLQNKQTLFFRSSVRFIRNWAESRALILPPSPPPSTTSLITNILYLCGILVTN